MVSEDKDQRYAAAIVHRDKAAGYQELLRQSGATLITFDGLSGTAGENIAASRSRVKQEEEQIEKLEKELAAYGEKLPKVQLAWDSTQLSIDCQKAEQNLLRTQETFLTEGWVPSAARERWKRALPATPASTSSGRPPRRTIPRCC